MCTAQLLVLPPLIFLNGHSFTALPALSTLQQTHEGSNLIQPHNLWLLLIFLTRLSSTWKHLPKLLWLPVTLHSFRNKLKAFTTSANTVLQPCYSVPNCVCVCVCVLMLHIVIHVSAMLSLSEFFFFSQYICVFSYGCTTEWFELQHRHFTYLLLWGDILKSVLLFFWSQKFMKQCLLCCCFLLLFFWSQKLVKWCLMKKHTNMDLNFGVRKSSKMKK